MADTGAPWNIPYVEPTDLVRDYPAADEAQALAVAGHLTDLDTAIGNVPLSAIGTVAFGQQTSALSLSNDATTTIYSASITPSAATSNIFITLEFYQTIVGGRTGPYTVELLRNATVIRSEVFRQQDVSQARRFTSPLIFKDSPATTSSVTYSLQIFNNTGNTIVGVRGSIILLEELG